MPGMAIRNWLVRSMRGPAGMARFYSRRPHSAAMHKPLDRALVWLRRDLRADDHAALYHALRAARQVWCAFVFDRAILDPRLPRRADRRVEFIRDSLVGAGCRTARAGRVAWRRRRGPDRAPRPGGGRDPAPGRSAGRAGGLRQPRRRPGRAGARRPGARRARRPPASRCTPAKDHVVFERSELLTQGGGPFCGLHAVQERLAEEGSTPFFLERLPGGPARRGAGTAAGRRWRGVPTLETLGFERTNLHQLRLPSGPRRRARTARRLPAAHRRLPRDARLPGGQGAQLPEHAPALRHGVDPPPRARGAWPRRQGGSRGAEVWLSELIWRDFYHQVLHHHPHVVSQAFKPEYDRITLGARQARRCAVRGLVRGPHRLPAGRRRDAPDQPDRLHAQPAAHGGGQLPDQGPGAGLAARRGLLRARI